MPEVTVCIPAYRSAAFIGQTLRSVRDQTFRDFVVEIGLEPVDHEPTIAAIRPLLADPRFLLQVNEERLGWSGNTRNLLDRVETPSFVVLPHDDVWHPRYLEMLVAALGRRPDASVAYSDVYLLGDSVGLRSIDLLEADLPQRLVAFFLADARAIPWRGVTRASVLDQPFPTNEFEGFGGEFEWALHLVTRGVALRVAEPLYLKLAYREEDSVTTRWRSAMPEVWVRAALEQHRTAILGRIATTQVPPEHRPSIESAAEASLLGRWVGLVDGRFDMTPEQRARADHLMRLPREDGDRPAGAIRSRTRLALSRHLLQQRGDRAGATRLAEEAVADDAEHWEASAHLARLYLRADRPLDALPLVTRAAKLAPLAAGLRRLEASCAERLSEMFPDRAQAG